MTFWHWLFLGLILAGILAVLYGLDRLLLWMEERGWVYYRKKRGSGGATAGLLTTMQQFVEPQAQHIIQIEERAKEHDRQEEGQPARVDEPMKEGQDAQGDIQGLTTDAPTFHSEMPFGQTEKRWRTPISPSQRPG